jgi:hypothetical protein
VFVRDGDRCWFVRLTEVAVIESDGNYARLDVPGQPMLPRSLSYSEARLQPGFFRASRKHLVKPPAGRSRRARARRRPRADPARRQGDRDVAPRGAAVPGKDDGVGTHHRHHGRELYRGARRSPARERHVRKIEEL